MPYLLIAKLGGLLLGGLLLIGSGKYLLDLLTSNNTLRHELSEAHDKNEKLASNCQAMTEQHEREINRHEQHIKELQNYAQALEQAHKGGNQGESGKTQQGANVCRPGCVLPDFFGDTQ